MSVTMNVIRDEGKRIPIELARTLYGEIGVAIEKYFEHLTYMEHFGVALCQFNLRPSDSANEYVADCCVLQADGTERRLLIFNLLMTVRPSPF